jgi:NAD-dependent DNA ligase
MPLTDEQGQPRVVFHPDALQDRHIDELIGICRGVVADDIVNEAEARYLAEWIDNHRDYAGVYPFDILYRRLHEMLADGVLDDEESRELVGILKQLTGESKDLPGVADASTSLPVDDPQPPIAVAGSSFVFTGVFTVGTRKKCEEIVVGLGGSMHKTVRKDTDYLVIGDIGSEQWIHSSHGRKIEKAIAYRQNGTGIAIVTEHHWIQYV